MNFLVYLRMAVKAFEDDIERIIGKSFYSAVEKKTQDRAESIYKQVIDTYYTGHEYKLWYDLYKKAEGKMSVDFIKSSQIKDVIRNQLKAALSACRGTLRHEFNKQLDSPGSSANTIVRSIGFLSPPGYGKTKYVISAVEELQREEKIVENFVFVDGLKYHTIFNPIASSLKTTTSLDSIVPTSVNRKVIAGLITKDRTLDPKGTETLTYEQILGNKKIQEILSYFISGTGGRLLGNIASKEITQIGKSSNANPLYGSILRYIAAQNDTEDKEKAARKIAMLVYGAGNTIKKISESLKDNNKTIYDFKAELDKYKANKPELFSVIQAIVYSLSIALMIDFISENESVSYNKETLKDIEVLSTYSALSDVFLGDALLVSAESSANSGYNNFLEHIKNYIESKGTEYSNEATDIVKKLYILLQVLYDKDVISDGIFLLEDVESFINGTYPRHPYWGAIDSIAQSVMSTQAGARYQSRHGKYRLLLFEKDDVTQQPQNFGSLYLRAMATKRFFSNGDGSISVSRIASIVDKVKKTIKDMKASLESISEIGSPGFYINLIEAIRTITGNPDIKSSIIGPIDGIGQDIHDMVYKLVSHINNVHSHALALLHPSFYVTKYDVTNIGDYIEEFVSKYVACQFFPEVSEYYYNNLSPFSDSTAALTLAFEYGIQELLYEAVNKYESAVQTLKQEGIRIANKINQIAEKRPISVTEKYSIIEKESSKVDEIINDTKLYVIIFDEILHNVTRENFAILLRIWDMLLNRTDFSRPNVYVILTGNSPSVQEINYIGQLLQSSGVAAKGQAGATSSITAENIAAFFARVDFYVVSPDYEYVLKNETGLTQGMSELVEEVRTLGNVSDLPAVDYFTTTMITPRMPQFDYFEAIVRSKINEIAKQEGIEETDSVPLTTKIELAVKLINNRLDSISEELRAQLKKCQSTTGTEVKNSFLCAISKLRPYFDLTGFIKSAGNSSRNSIIKSLIKTSFKNQATDYKIMFGIGYAPILLYTAIYDTLRTIPSLYNKAIGSLIEALRTAPASTGQTTNPYNSALEDTMEAIESVLDLLRNSKTRKEITESYAKNYPIWIMYVLAAYKFIVNMMRINPNIVNVFASLDYTEAADDKFIKHLDLFDLMFDKSSFLNPEVQKVSSYDILSANMKEVYRDITIDIYFLTATLRFERTQGKNKIVACPFDVTIPDPAIKEAVRSFAKLLMLVAYKMLDAQDPRVSIAERLLRGFYGMLGLWGSSKFHISLRDYSNYVARVVNSVIGYVYMLNILKTIVEQDTRKFLSECCPDVPEEIKAAYEEVAKLIKKYAVHIISYDPNIHKGLHIYHDMSKQSSQEQSKYYYSEEVANFLACSGLNNAISTAYYSDKEVYNYILQKDADIIFKKYFVDVLSKSNASSTMHLTQSPIAGLCYLSMVEAEAPGAHSKAASKLEEVPKLMEKFIQTGGSHIEVASTGSTAKGLLHVQELVTLMEDIFAISNIETPKIEIDQSVSRLTLTSYLKSKNIHIVNEMNKVRSLLMTSDKLGWLEIGKSIEDKSDKIYRLYEIYRTNKEKTISKFVKFVEILVRDFLNAIEPPKPENDIINWISQNTQRITSVLNDMISNPTPPYDRQDIQDVISTVLKYIDSSRLDKKDIDKIAYEMSIGRNTLIGIMNTVMSDAQITGVVNKIKEIGIEKLTRFVMSEYDTELKATLNDSLLGSPILRIKFIWTLLGSVLIGTIKQNNTNILEKIVQIIKDFDTKMYNNDNDKAPYLREFIKVVLKNRHNRAGRATGSLIKLIYSKKVDVEKSKLYKHTILNKYLYEPNERYLMCSLHMNPIDSIRSMGNVITGITDIDSITKNVKLDDIITVYSGPEGQAMNVLSSQEIAAKYLIDYSVIVTPKYAFAENIAEHSMLIGAIASMSNHLVKQGNSSISIDYINNVMPFVIASLYDYYGLHKLSDNPTVNEVRGMVWGDKPLHPWLFVLLVAANSGIITEALNEKMKKDYGTQATQTPSETAYSNRISFMKFLSNQTKYEFSVSLIHPYMPVYEIKIQ